MIKVYLKGKKEPDTDDHWCGWDTYIHPGFLRLTKIVVFQEKQIISKKRSKLFGLIKLADEIIVEPEKTTECTCAMYNLDVVEKVEIED